MKKNKTIILILVAILILLIGATSFIVVKDKKENKENNNLTTNNKNNDNQITNEPQAKTQEQLDEISGLTFNNYDGKLNAYDFELNINARVEYRDISKKVIYQTVYNKLLSSNLVKNTSQAQQTTITFKKEDFVNTYLKFFSNDNINEINNLSVIELNGNTFNLTGGEFKCIIPYQEPDTTNIAKEIISSKYLILDYNINDNVLKIDAAIYYYKLTESNYENPEVYSDKELTKTAGKLNDINANKDSFAVYQYIYNIVDNNYIFAGVERIK